MFRKCDQVIPCLGNQFCARASFKVSISAFAGMTNKKVLSCVIPAKAEIQEVEVTGRTWYDRVLNGF